MIKIVSATPQDDYSLILAFDNGTKRVFDVRPYLDKGIFVELKDLMYFRQVRVAFNTVQWPHEQDFAPETLYLESKELVNAS
ncbi:MAG: DUF2442 domain-containing protein [Ignavibacteriae bacterium]|nr:DUF2442 domain-containing protein [Ignavibacteriota bacterium]